MSLIRLLAAGSSLRGIKDRPSPYKMSQQHLLPKFGSGKQLETPVAALEPVSQPMRTSSLPKEQITPPASREERIQMPVAEAQTPSVVEPAAPRPGRQTRQAGAPLWRWAQSKNPFRPKPVRKIRQLPAQGELLLDGVKVVRNDLNEADLELVTTATPPPPAEVPVQSSSPSPAGRMVWQRVATRLFGGGGT